MSISDMIVVMKKGVVQQIGEPQKVYDDPENLFVAKFLGTPPINVFNGHLSDEKLFIGESAVLDVPGFTEQKDVVVGIRPEGFIPAEDGPLACTIENIEVMGRDCSVVSTHPSSQNPIVRSIVDSDIHIKADENGAVRFALRKNKVFIFDKETETRILF